MAFLLLLAGILSLKVKVIIEANEEARVYLKILFIKIKLFPQDKKPPKLSDYDPKRLAKQEEKNKKKEEAKQKKKAEKEKKKKEKKEKEKNSPTPKKKMSLSDILDLVQLVLKLAKTFFVRFGKRLRLDITRIHITVASDDAAATAIMYGAVSQGVGVLVDFLDKIFNIKPDKNKDIQVYADFLSEKPHVDIKVAASLRVWHVFDMLFSVAFKFVKEKLLKTK